MAQPIFSDQETSNSILKNDRQLSLTAQDPQPCQIEHKLAWIKLMCRREGVLLQCKVSNVTLLPMAKTYQIPCKTRSLYRLQSHTNLQNLAAVITFEAQGLPSISGANYHILKGRRLKLPILDHSHS